MFHVIPQILITFNKQIWTLYQESRKPGRNHANSPYRRKEEPRIKPMTFGFICSPALYILAAVGSRSTSSNCGIKLVRRTDSHKVDSAWPDHTRAAKSPRPKMEKCLKPPSDETLHYEREKVFVFFDNIKHKHQHVNMSWKELLLNQTNCGAHHLNMCFIMSMFSADDIPVCLTAGCHPGCCLLSHMLEIESAKVFCFFSSLWPYIVVSRWQTQLHSHYTPLHFLNM